MASLDQRDIAIVTADGRFRVEFRWRQDRFSHRILIDQVEVARSVEGDADEAWPDSPPLQQLSLEDIKGSETILGVGSAGRSHWSLSVQVESGHQPANRFRFDLATRCRDHAASVRSTYLATDSIVFEPCDGALIEDSSANDSGWGRITIRPGETSRDATSQVGAPLTHRWSYRIAPSRQPEKTTLNS